MTSLREGAGRAVRSELLRKAVHLAAGGFALLLRWLTPLEASLCAAAALLFNLFLLHRLTGRALLRHAERERGFSYGIVLYPAAVLALILVFHRRLEIAAAAWALLAFGDGMATVAGIAVGGPRLPWNREKSWAGLFAFVLYGGLAAALLLRWVQQGVLDRASRGGPAVDWIGGSFLAASARDAPATDLWLLLGGCFAAAAVAALAESARTGLDDNVLVPLVGGAALYAAVLVEPGRIQSALPGLAAGAAVGGGVNLLLAIAAFFTRGVTASGAMVGWVLGTLLFALAGWRGFSMLLLFFVLGTACTRLGYARKAAIGVAQAEGGRRSARHAVANSAAGVVFAFLAVATARPEAFSLALVAAFATAAADTVSSEVGQAYGRSHYLITTFRKVPAGTEGAVSLEGTLAGLVAAVAVAGSGWGVGILAPWGVAIVAAAGLLGSTAESALAAASSEPGRLDNEALNLANTVVGGGLALLIAWAAGCGA